MKSSLNSKGMTLIELTMASSMLLLISAVMAVALVRVYTINKDAINQGLNNSNLQIAISNLTQNIREARQSDSGGYLILSGDDFDLKFYSDRDDDSTTERLHYFIEDGYLKLGVTDPIGDYSEYPEGDDETSVIAKDIVNGSDEPIFYYYDKDAISGIEDDPMTTPIIPDEVGLIKLHLITNVNPQSGSSGMEIETFVRPRNIDY